MEVNSFFKLLFYILQLLNINQIYKKLNNIYKNL